MAGIFSICSCIPSGPVDDDPRVGFNNKWQIDMGEAPFQATGSCLYGGICCPCAHYQLRTKAINYDMKNYKCCQGYVNCCCIKPGSMGEESCPEVCLALESCCCLGCAVSATRFHVMDQYNLVSDPCDNRIIRFNNFIQLLSCIISLLSICISELRDAAVILDIIAKIVFYCTVGCMHAQTWNELEFRAGQANGTFGQQAPPVQGEMSRGQEQFEAEAKPVVSDV